MMLRVGERLNIPVINAQEALAAHDGSVFIPHNHRFSARGHEVVAREAATELAKQIGSLSFGDG